MPATTSGLEKGAPSDPLLASLLKATQDNPQDWVSYLALADLLDERGERKMARAWRFMGRNRRCPRLRQITWRVKKPRLLWAWYLEGGGHPHAGLPAPPVRRHELQDG